MLKGEQTIYAIIFMCLFLLLVAISHLLYQFLKISSENSRKFLHVSGGILALCAPLFFSSHWWVLVLCSLAFFLLLFTYIKHWLPSIHQTERKSIGSVIYPIPIYICFLVASQKNNNLLFFLPISLLTASDTIAEWAGKKRGINSGKLMNGNKTVAGSISFAISALLISVAYGIIFNHTFSQILILSVTISLIATVTELVSTRGFDNITVPLITLLCLMLLESL